MKILLLEDDIALGETIQELLESSGYSVDYVVSGQEAIDKSYENNYDMYIFDINVPDVDGLEILRLLRNSDDETHTIIISAMTDLQTILKGFDIGANDFIKKPFYPQELLAKVNLKFKSKDIIIGDIIYKRSLKQILKGKESIYLSRVLLDIFDIFATNLNRIVYKEELYECLEKPNDNALRVQINKLKSLTGLEIKNIRGSGYILETNRVK